MTIHDPQKARLVQLVSEHNNDMQAVLLHHEGAVLLGHVLLDALEEAGYSPQEVDMAGGIENKALGIGMALLQAAASRGLELDLFNLVPISKGTENTTCSIEMQLFGAKLQDKAVVVLSLSPNKGNCVKNVIKVVKENGGKVIAAAVGLELTTTLREEIKAEGVELVAAITQADLAKL